MLSVSFCTTNEANQNPHGIFHKHLRVLSATIRPTTIPIITTTTTTAFRRFEESGGQNDTDSIGRDETNATNHWNDTLLIDPDGTPPNGIYISEAGFIALLVILGLLLILVVLVACVYVCLRMRKRRQEKKHEQKALELFMANQRQHQPPKSSQSNVYSDIISSGQKIQQNAPKFKSRTKTKTNGSLSPSLVQHSLPERRHSERSISSSLSSQIGDANQAYIGSPVVQVRKPKSKRTTPAPPPPPPQREVQLSPRQLISNQGRDRRPLPPETLRQMSWGQSMESSSDSDFEPMDVPYQGPPPPIRRHASQTDYSRQFKKPSAEQKAASLNSPQVQQGQPFNYITFSEMLYGDHRRQQPLGSPDLSSSRAVSYV